MTDYVPSISDLLGCKKPIARSTKPLKRSRIKKHPKRARVTKDNRVILDAAGMGELRRQKHDAANGCCEKCGGPAPLEGHELVRGQLAHWPPKGMGNAHGSDDAAHTLWTCPTCHNELDGRNQKVCPKKPAVSDGADVQS